MGSTRLPGKIFKEINGMPSLKYQIDRVSKSNLIDKIIVATTVLDKDDMVVKFCNDNNIEYFRGSEDDVLDRYYQCAKEYGVDIIVRLTADCPLLDPKMIDKAIELFKSEKADYAANTAPPETSKYPGGSDVEVFSIEALERAHTECKDMHDREHVTFYFWKYDNRFRVVQLGSDRDYSKYRFTVDYPEDLEVVAYIASEINKRRIFGHFEEIIDIIDAAPEVKKKNLHYSFDIGWKRNRR